MDSGRRLQNSVFFIAKNAAADGDTGVPAARAIADMQNPGVTDLSTLTDGLKQKVSTLATTAAGWRQYWVCDIGGQAGKNAAENNTLGKNDKLPLNIRNINQLKPNILDADCDSSTGGGVVGKSKRSARTVLTGMCYLVGSATRQGSSSPTRFSGQSAMTSRTW